jgi:hypothetical protein
VNRKERVQHKCRRKKRYSSKGEAAMMLRHLRATKRIAQAWKLEVYSCGFCPGWHIGHASVKKRRARA